MSEKRFKKGDWTNCRYDICEIVTDDDEIICVVALNDVDKIIGLLEENEQLKKQVKKLKIDNEALQDSNDALAELMSCLV